MRAGTLGAGNAATGSQEEVRLEHHITGWLSLGRRQAQRLTSWWERDGELAEDGTPGRGSHPNLQLSP